MQLKKIQKKKEWHRPIRNFKLKKKIKSFLLKRALKYKWYRYKPTQYLDKKFYIYSLNIIVKQNNIFCSLINLSTKKLLLLRSSGKYKIKVSKKKIKHTFKLMLNTFFQELRKKEKISSIIINLTAPIKIKKKILEMVAQNFKRRLRLIKVNRKKCYNGCRPSKQVRKKRKGFKLLK